MTRAKMPSFERIEELRREKGIQLFWIALGPKRCYIRERGVMRAQGWLITFIRSWSDMFDHFETVFLPD